jgi:hypothetical protein
VRFASFPPASIGKFVQPDSRLGVVVIIGSAPAFSMLEEEDDSPELIPGEFIPMGPEVVFRS